MDHFIEFNICPFEKTSVPAGDGIIIFNPPYGERIGDKKEIEELYKGMGKHFKTFETWSYYIITPYPDFEKLFGLKANRKRKLYNGTIKCDYYQFYGPKPPVSKDIDETLDICEMLE